MAKKGAKKRYKERSQVILCGERADFEKMKKLAAERGETFSEFVTKAVKATNPVFDK